MGYYADRLKDRLGNMSDAEKEILWKKLEFLDDCGKTIKDEDEENEKNLSKSINDKLMELFPVENIDIGDGIHDVNAYHRNRAFSLLAYQRDKICHWLDSRIFINANWQEIKGSFISNELKKEKELKLI